MATTLTDLLHHPELWRAGRLESPAATVATGFPVLDAVLAGRGWPRAGLVELASDAIGIGELRLLAPALATLAAEPRWITWINPPHIPYAPALASLGIDVRKVLLVHPAKHIDAVWATERALKSGTASALLAWFDESKLKPTEVRKLKLAAREGNALAVLFRPATAVRQASMAELRIRLETAATDQLIVDVCKRRGGWPTTLTVPLPAVPRIGRNVVVEHLKLWRARPARIPRTNTPRLPIMPAQSAPQNLTLH